MEPSVFTPPDHFIRKGMLPMQRLKDWNRHSVKQVPDELVTHVQAQTLRLRVGNILPVGLFMLVFAGLIGISQLFLALALLKRVAAEFNQSAFPGFSLFMLLIAILFIGLAGLCCYLAYRTDYLGSNGDGLTTFDRKRRKIYQRMHLKLGKGEWDWDKLVPYVETRHQGSRINQALTLVEFDETNGQPVSYATVHVVAMLPDPLTDTYTFLSAFMDKGITSLPPVTLSAIPLPGWYQSSPPWFFGLPRPLAKSVWSFFIAALVWPVVAWSRFIRRFLPYNQWPKAQLAQWAVDDQSATNEEQQWLQQNIKPPEPVPTAARIAFGLAVIVTAPLWWMLLSGYVTGLIEMVAK
jgi:hypothetical protein